MPEKTPSPRRAAYLRTVRREKRRVRIWQIALVAGLFAVWELSCRLGLSDGFLVSSPSRMVQTLWRLCASGELWHHAAVSIGETVLGFTAGTVLGTAVAVAMWWSDTAARILDPYLVVLNALPKTALGPIFIVWMGAGMGAIVTMTLAISLIVTILSMYTGFRTTDPEKLRLMRTLGADKRQILWLLVFPANCPTLFSTLKVNVGLSWVGVIMGEFLVSRAGLGYLIVYGSQVFNMDLVMASVLVLGLGNRRMTADALGDRVVSGILVTRHMQEERLRSVCAVAPGVLGITGVETAELALGLAERVKPSAVIVVDALAAMETAHIGTTIQLTDTGIVPGSGVGNSRQEFSQRTLGVPVVAVGVPTVMDAAGALQPALTRDMPQGLLVTLRDVDARVREMGRLVGYGCDLALHRGLSLAEIPTFLS